MALEGTLRDFSFADILQLISLQRKTGVLTLKHEDKLVTISFLDGCIVGSSTLSQHSEDRIGLILLKRGEITEQELSAALRRQEETLQRLGRILIESKVVSLDTLREALEQQILQIVYRVFRWSDGDYHFSQEKTVDYDRELMEPMAADSIIMEGARMTDEWPFIDQRIPDRRVVFTKVNPLREFEIVEDEDDDFEDLGFSFMEAPDEAPKPQPSEDRMTRNQLTIYDLVSGRDSVEELILESPLIEFETCKALADLVDRRIIREATQEEIARQLRRDTAPVPAARRGIAFPWLALPLAALLAFSLWMVPHNRFNPAATARSEIWEDLVLESVSWLRMVRLERTAESYFALEGLYPESAADLLDAGYADDIGDPWRRPYRLTSRDGRLIVTGTDAAGEPAPSLTISRYLALEGDEAVAGAANQPGVRLVE
jgi:hypothetical protein